MKTSMKMAVLALALLLSSFGVLMAQKASLFTYDQERVSSTIEGIDESTVEKGPVSCFVQDSARAESTGMFWYYLAGFFPGCLSPQLGFWTGYIISGLEGSKVGIIIGSIVGVLAPPVVAYLKKELPRPVKFTGLGAVTGAAPGIFLSVGYYDAAKAAEELTNTIGGCIDLFNSLDQASCTGLYLTLPMKIGRTGF